VQNRFAGTRRDVLAWLGPWLDSTPEQDIFTRMSGDKIRLSEGGEPTGPHAAHCHRHHRRRKFRVRPEALGECYETYDAMPLMPRAASAAAAATLTAPEPERASEPEAEIPSERETARRTAQKGLRICLEVLVLVFVCAHLRQIWRLCLSAGLAWPDWAHDWAAASFLPL
jgi:hypothetical protein